MNQKLVCFDLDGTLIHGNISFHFGKYLYRRKKMPLSTVLQNVFAYGLHKANVLSLEKLHTTIFNRQFRGSVGSEMDLLAQTFLHQNLSSYLNLPILDTLRVHQAQGDIIVLLSSSPSFLVLPLAAILGIGYSNATQYHADVSGRFASISTLMDGANKGRTVRQLESRLHIPVSQIIAYSDSFLDLPFLEAAGRAIAVNPDRKLKRICMQRGWSVRA